MRYATVRRLLAGAARRFGAAPAVVTAESTLSFAELLEGVAAMAAGLRTRGVRAGDRILMAAGNSAATVQAWLGAIYTGALPALVNPQLTEPELAYLKQDLEPVLTLLGEAELAELPAVGQPDPHPAGALDPAAIVYTSGTTSRPKGVLVRHAAYTETGLSFPGWIGLGPEERLWACLPLFHINAQAYSLMSALMQGHSMALSERFHASTFWQDAGELEVTSVNVIGAMLTFLERQPAERFVRSRLRTIYAAPAPDPVHRRELEARFQVRITGGYGMSENTFGCAESPGSRDKPGSIGRPRQPASGAFENRLRIVEGALCFQNPGLTPGHWSAPHTAAR